MDPRFFKIAHVGGGAGTICPNMYIYLGIYMVNMLVNVSTYVMRGLFTVTTIHSMFVMFVGSKKRRCNWDLGSWIQMM